MPQIHRNIGLATLALAAALATQPAAAQSADAARQAAAKALQSNPEVLARMKAYLGKTNALDAASAGYLPRVDLNADAGVDRSKDKGVTGQTSLNRAGVGLSISQLLWDGMGTRNEVNRAGHDRMGRWFEFVDVSEQTALEATRAVYDVQRQRKLVALAEDNLRQHKEAADKIESRVQAGVGRGVDLDQAKARLSLAESNLDTEVANLHDVAARYQRVVGEAPVPNMGALEVLKNGMPGNATDAAEIAIGKSPAIAATIENLRAARAAELGRRSALQPRVEARARVGGGQNYTGVDGRKADAAVELVMNWNVFDGGANQARVREQENNVGQAQDLRDKACREVRQTVAIAFNDANKLMGQVNTLARNSAAIERARLAYRQQFDIGQRSLLDLLNAENEAYTARRALTNAVFDRAVAHARTLAAMSQLTVQLDLARNLVPKDSPDWSAGDDSARCPLQPVSVAALRAGAQVDPLPLSVAEPAPAPAPAPGAVAKVAPLVQAWAQSLASRNMPGYVALYTPGFVGDEESEQQWLNKTRYQFGSKKPLKVELEGLTASALDDRKVEVRFRQILVASGRQTVQDKVQLWALQPDGQWRIARDASL